MTLTVLAWLAAAPLPAAAQVGVGAGISPDAFIQGERTVREQMPILPLALAASLAFDTTTWASVGVSSVPAKDLSALLKRGYYKLELLQAVLVASRAKVPLKDVTAAHDKGQALREVAQAKGLDFDSVYEEALAIDKRVIDELLPSIMTVAVTPPKPRTEKKK